MGRIVPFPRTSAWRLGLSAFAAALLLSALLLSGHSPMGREREQCTGDVQLPITVRVIPEETPHPGAALRVRVEVEALRSFGDATVSVLAPADVPVTAGGRGELGPLAEHRPVSHAFTIVVPAHGERRTVDVKVRAQSDDGFAIEQGATLNLSFEDEPGRVVTDQNGTRIREVPARRIQ
jgi:hypothetical protein